MRIIRKINKLYFIVLIFCFQYCSEVFEPSLSNLKVILSAPVNNLVSDSSIQTFYWQTLTGANKYELQVVSPKFDSIVALITDTTIQGNFFQISLIQGKYQWRVRAFNSSSATPFSSDWALTIQ